MNAPFPEARPFDLPRFDGTGPLPARPVAPINSGSAESAPATADPASRAVTNAPAPPRRPDIAPQSNPDEEDDEPQWPRRTPQQRDLPMEPRVPEGPPFNGISTDPGTSIGCLPAELRKVLNALVSKYGGVHVTSTWRPVWRARRNSYHRRCQAVDFRIPGQSPRVVLEFVKTLPQTGGHKVYWNGLVHVDVGPWRTW